MSRAIFEGLNNFGAGISNGIVQSALINKQGRESEIFKGLLAEEDPDILAIAGHDPQVAQLLQGIQQQEHTNQQEQQQLDMNTLGNIAMVAHSMEDPAKIRAFLTAQAQQGHSEGVLAEIADTLNMDDDQMMNDIRIALEHTKTDATAGQRERDDLLSDIAPALDENGAFDPTKADARALSAAAELGIYAKKGTLSKDERIAGDPTTAEDVAQTQALIEERKAKGKEEGKLGAQLEMRPEVEAAVTKAVEAVKFEAKRDDKAVSNESALAVYDQAMSGLVGALSGTETGPGMNWISLTADQQIADGAVAAMAPVLKQLFRVAGEGNFTDKDQEMLLAMVPTRKDHPEAIRAKIQNIDGIVRMKLGAGVDKQQGPNIDDLVNKYAN